MKEKKIKCEWTGESRNSSAQAHPALDFRVQKNILFLTVFARSIFCYFHSTRHFAPFNGPHIGERESFFLRSATVYLIEGSHIKIYA